jgi:hypothetical protein
MRGVAYVLGFVGVAIVVGCSIGSTDSLFTSGGVGGGTAGAGPGSGGSVVTGNPTAGGRGQGGATTSTSHASSVSATVSSSEMSSSVMSSSSTGGPTSMVTCGDGLSCPVNGEHACCWEQFGQQGGTCVMGQPMQDGCDTSQNPQTGFHARITCDSPKDCPTGFCCGHLVFTGGGGDYYDEVSCQTVCDNQNVRICDPNDMLQTCLNGTSCQQSGLLPNGYFVCR